MSDDLHDPWLVAAWPGMGNVAVAAGWYLVQTLGAELVHELSSRALFEIEHIEVKSGLANVGRVPRSLFFEWRDPADRHDLLIFIGEAQPSVGGYKFCHKLLDYAATRGVRRVITFAAMATQLHPSSEPRVFGVATESPLLEEVQRLGVEILNEGQISGLNGVLLAAGAERGLPGLCLLGELPFFAVGVPNPKASQAVLDLFSRMSGIHVDLSELADQGEAVEHGLLELLEKMKQAAGEESEEEGGIVLPAPDKDAAAPKSDSVIDETTSSRIETLFADAMRDRNKAFRLKQELDRLGVFDRYEDRFLDLFRKAE